MCTIFKRITVQEMNIISIFYIFKGIFFLPPHRYVVRFHDCLEHKIVVVANYVPYIAVVHPLRHEEWLKRTMIQLVVLSCCPD